MKMKNVLFIGITNFNFKKFPPLHREKQFSELSKAANVFVLTRGAPFHKKIWGTDFYLIPKRLLYFILALPLGAYLCLAKKIDVIICQSPLTEGILGVMLKKIFRKELIISIHGDWQEGPFLSRKRRFESIERRITPILAKISLRLADKIRAVTMELAKEAKKIAPQKPYYIFPTFTDIDMFLAEKENGFDSFILFVGQLAEVKGVQYLIDGFSKIEKDFPDFKLVVIGDGPARENLKLQVVNYQLQNRIEFKGRLPLKETKNVIKNCYCLVLPSLSEGLPRVLMEAMALRKPVIGTKVGGIPEIIQDGENGLLVKAGDPQDLADKLRILLGNRELAKTMGQRGREFIEKNYSNQQHNKAYLKMIYSSSP